MHDAVLFLHSWVRWVAIITGVLATVSVLGATADGRNNRWAKIFTISVDIQFLLGLILVMTSVDFGRMGEVMRDSTARFYAVEHPTMMIVAIALAHMGRVFARKALTPASARTKSLIFFGLSTLLLIGGTPWPGTHDNRPLFNTTL
ncbi:MAG: hypothetical protein JSU08_11070 [Acidobacteria bacterium]|nr:hypothetical protein [Acidobacteriota bacterium]